MRKLAILLALLCICASAFAMLGNLLSGISQLCSGISTLLPVASMLMIVFAAVVYAAGQMMGAETRARANVWATTCITGALLGVLIVSVAPPLLKQLYGPDISCAGEGSSPFLLPNGADCSASSQCLNNNCCCVGVCGPGTCNPAGSCPSCGIPC